MKSTFSLKDNNKFSQLSGDKNKIHLDMNFTKNFFVKFPIVHGVHIVIFALSEFFKKNKNDSFFINYLNIKFNNYLNINDKFKIIFLQNKIIIQTDSLIITEIDINYLKSKKKIKEVYNFNNYFFKNLKNKSIIKELLILSKYIGTKNPGHGSIILNFKIASQINKKIKITQRKITNRLSHFIILKKKYSSNLVVTKPKKFKFDFKNFSPNKKLKKKFKKKSILIFGSTGSLGSFAKYYFSKYSDNVYFADRSCKKKKFNSFIINLKNKNNLYKIINFTKPDVVLYFISPKIKKSYKKYFDYKLYKKFEFYYYNYFKKIIHHLKNLNKKVIVFYPSSVALNKNNISSNFPKEYIKAKRKAEISFSNKIIKDVIVNFYRIDKIQSLQNYNITGFYEGSPVNVLKKNLDNFINKY